MIHITSDSTTDLGELYEKRGIKTLPLAVVLGKDTYEDGVTVHPNDIYDFVAKNKVLPKTAARSVEEHREFFASILKSDEDSIVHFTISSKLSVTYQNAVAAAKEFKTCTLSIRTRSPRAADCSRCTRATFATKTNTPRRKFTKSASRACRSSKLRSL